MSLKLCLACSHPLIYHTKEGCTEILDVDGDVPTFCECDRPGWSTEAEIFRVIEALRADLAAAVEGRRLAERQLVYAEENETTAVEHVHALEQIIRESGDPAAIEKAAALYDPETEPYRCVDCRAFISICDHARDRIIGSSMTVTGHGSEGQDGVLGE